MRLKMNSQTMRARGRRAFTLIEVLIALAIFVMMAVVLGMAYSNVLTSYEVAARVTKGDDDVRFARAALLAEPEREKAELGAEFDGENGRRVRWKAVIEPTNVADLFTVTFICEINAPDLPKPQLTQDVFRLLRPTWSEAADRDKLKADAKTRIQKIQQGLANK